MDFAQLLQGMGGLGAGAMDPDKARNDTAETIYISSLALLKMLKHGRAGVPMEVMGLLLGRFVDEYTVEVVDVAGMPQSGTAVSVETVDEKYQWAMQEHLKEVGRPENCVGWYHSHPGFGCWLSGVDVNTAKSFEKLHERAVSVVIDPIQSVRGRVVIDAFRTVDQQDKLLNLESRQVTSNVGHVEKPTIQALIHGLNKYYYSMPVKYRATDLERNVLLKVHKGEWFAGLQANDFKENSQRLCDTMESIERLAVEYQDLISSGKDVDEVANVGKLDAKRNLNMEIGNTHTESINHVLTNMMDAIVF